MRAGAKRETMAAVLPLLAACADPESASPKADPPACEAPSPPAGALLLTGDNAGIFTLPDGRTLTPAGTQVELGGFPADVAIVNHHALVTNTTRDARSLAVLSLPDGALTDEVVRNDAFPGFALDGDRAWVSGGDGGLIDVYDVSDEGLLTSVASLPVGGFIAGLAFDADGDLWGARFLEHQLVELDPTTGAEKRTVDLDSGPYALTYVPETDELWATAFAADQLLIVDQAAAVETDAPEVGGNPSDLLLSPDGSVAWLTLSNDDTVVALDPQTHAVLDSVRLGGTDIVDDDGAPLPGTSPSSLALRDDRLFVTRAADNAVDVLDAATLDVLGSIPTGWYPTALALDGDTLVVTNGKGVGSGDTADGTFISDAMVGTVSVVDYDDALLGGWSGDVLANTTFPSDAYPFACDGTFPVPLHLGDPTPLRHVILIVRENKTYDSLLGDLAEGDPSLLGYPVETTPNLHSLATTFTNSTNFYYTSESSVQGHLALTGMFVNEYMERAWIEDYHGVGELADDGATGSGTPGFGTVFTHLYRNGVDFTDYGEIVGAFDEVDGQSMGDFVDLSYPGGFFNLEVSDQERAEYVAERIAEGTLASFTYMLLPRDHTYGDDSGEPTVESMVADNDYATGLVVDALSHSPYWESSVVFVVEDDPQSEQDHVDGHRGVLLVISPYAKRGHDTAVHTSYPGLYRTIYAILGVPPLSRHDAVATPLYDAFTSVPDLTPYRVVARQWPEETNARTAAAAEPSRCLDFSGPDRNPLMTDVLWWHRHGTPRPGSKWAAGERDCAVLNGGADADDADAWDDAWVQFERWKTKNPGRGEHIVRPQPPAWRRDEDDDDGR